MALTEVDITGQWDGPVPGDPAAGTVTFELTGVLADPGNLLIPRRRVTVTLDEDGAIPAGMVLYATDDPSVQPEGVAYQMVVRLDGSPADVRNFNLSHLLDTYDVTNSTSGAPSPPTTAWATQAYVDSETARAETAETANAAAIAAETTRAITAEATKATTAALTAETTRATAAETANWNAIVSETVARAVSEALLIPLAQKGADSGVATLDSGGHVPQAQIPAVALSTYLGDTASDAAMLALTAQPGDWTVRTDYEPDRAYMLNGSDPAVLGNWKRMTFGDVISVNGQTGAVTGLAVDTAVVHTTGDETKAGVLTLSSVPLTPGVSAAATGTSAGRFMGAVNGAAPTTGTFLAGDWVVDRSSTAPLTWVCTAGGSPGTWKQSGFGTYGRYDKGIPLSTFAGTDPTGVAECAAAVQTAINACAGLTTLLVDGTFKCSTQLTIPSDSRILAFDPDQGGFVFTWQLTTSGSAYIVNADTTGAAHDITLRNFRVTGAGNGAPFGTPIQTAGPATGILMRRVTRFRISGLDVTNVPGVSIAYQGCPKGRISGNTVRNGGRDGITGWWFTDNLTDIVVANNVIHTVGDDGIALNSSTAGNPNTSARPRRISVANNTIYGMAAFPGGTSTVTTAAGNANLTLSASAGVAPAQDMVITIPGAGVAGADLSTTIQTVTDATHIVLAVAPSTVVTATASYSNGAGRGILVIGCEDVAITGNSISDTFASGIYVQADTLGSAFRAQNVTIVGNNVRNAGQPGQASQPRNGIRANGCDGLVVQGNSVTGSYGVGIYVTDAAAPNVSNNDVSGNGTNMSSTAVDYGIDIDGVAGTRNVQSPVVSGNTVRRNAGGGIRLNYCHEAQVSGNTCTDNGNAGNGTLHTASGVVCVGDTEFNIVGNTCTDTRAGGSRTQTFGISVPSVGGNPTVVIANNMLISNVGVGINIGQTCANLTLTGNFTPAGITISATPTTRFIRGNNTDGTTVGPSRFTGNGTYTVPLHVTEVEIVAVGGGSGGGGGGAATSSGGISNQVGGAGGGAGAPVVRKVTVTPGDTLTVTIGAGGAGGAGGAADNHAGSNGSTGSDTTVTGTGVSVTAKGSSVSGRGGGANSATTVGGGCPGSGNASVTTANIPGCGGPGVSGGANQGGGPNGYAGGGGGAGGTGSATNGGGAGNAGTAIAAGAGGSTGGSGTTAGVAGTDAAANTGAGGGGGGAGAPGGAGAAGGAGGSGYVIITPISTSA